MLRDVVQTDRIGLPPEVGDSASITQMQAARLTGGLIDCLRGPLFPGFCPDLFLGHVRVLTLKPGSRSLDRLPILPEHGVTKLVGIGLVACLQTWFKGLGLRLKV